MNEKSNEKGQIKSIRFDEETYRRIKAYAAGSGVTDSAAIRELVVKGLSVDGLGLYSTELGEYLRTTMNGCLASFEEALRRRNDEAEDRLARVTSRSTKGALVAALVACDLAKGLFEGLADVSVEDVYRAYARQAGELQAGRSIDEVKADARAGR
ncbi:hypothetical protein [Thermophilibacter immobilis]|mgnify:FL=1|jgi:hypothetical protein|uniref:Uncharacterized protein n=1 Tax=Thermophilibacter immobilis TaxID=2779519 RepID=A0A7S7RUI7_9ACTN|nr:hypothetical protein [Thermophilibacter immobilis]QOY60618.1 hypothetical protein INP52_09595 [Thermophilibacter immobilis]